MTSVDEKDIANDSVFTEIGLGRFLVKEHDVARDDLHGTLSRRRAFSPTTHASFVGRRQIE